MAIIAKVAERPTEKPGLYPAVLTDVEETEVEFQGERQERYRWRFRARRKDETTFEISELTTRKFATGRYEAKARRWAEMLLGRPVERAEEAAGFDLTSLVGRECQVLVGVKTTDRGTFNRIDDVLPADPE